MNPNETAARQPTESRPHLISIATTPFVVLQSHLMPEFGFLIREDAEPRYGWEAWLTIRNAQVDVLPAVAERSDYYHRVRIASNAGELDALPLIAAAPPIATTCHGNDIATIFIQHACRQWLWSDELVIPDIRVVDLTEYPLALLSRYGTEVIAGALAFVNWSKSRGIPRPITFDRLRFLECHTTHLERDLEIARRFRR